MGLININNGYCRLQKSLKISSYRLNMMSELFLYGHNSLYCISRTGRRFLYLPRGFLWSLFTGVVLSYTVRQRGAWRTLRTVVDGRKNAVTKSLFQLSELEPDRYGFRYEYGYGLKKLSPYRCISSYVNYVKSI